MSPTFTQPPPMLLLERKLGGGYRITLFPETVNACFLHLSEAQYKELRRQMSMFNGTSQAEAERSFDQSAPTGNGRIVLFEVFSQCCVGSEDIAVMLLERAIKGREKYKTWLRAHNGRNALQDALDEALDGLMYATQVNMEQPSYDAEELQRCFLEAAQLCKQMMERK